MTLYDKKAKFDSCRSKHRLIEMIVDKINNQALVLQFFRDFQVYNFREAVIYLSKEIGATNPIVLELQEIK